MLIVATLMRNQSALCAEYEKLHHSVVGDMSAQTFTVDFSSGVTINFSISCHPSPRSRVNLQELATKSGIHCNISIFIFFVDI